MNKQEPVVGYGGFLKGVRAENDYGQSFRDIAKRSIQGWEGDRWWLISKDDLCNKDDLLAIKMMTY